MKNLDYKKGFSLIEMLVIIGILVILISMSASALLLFRKESDLSNNAEEIVSALRRAQNKSLASEAGGHYGVYFNSSQYILFKGEDYVSRDSSFDEINELPNNIEIYEIDLAGGNEIVFDRITGITNRSGNVSLRLKDNPAKTESVYIDGSGRVGLDPPAIPANSRTEDSRHVHFDYSRIIDTANETLTLSFEGGVNEIIVIADNMKDSQIFWEGEVEVGSEIQNIKIHTHRLNSPDTQFSVHRDRRYNNKSLIITISGDISGSLIEYSTDGLTTNSSSVNVSSLIWQ
jgi:type II secretory pathway pseudopilin PulG